MSATVRPVAERAFIEEATERLYSVVTEAYSYIFQQGSRDGHWQEARATALAAMCLETLCKPDSPWREAVKKWISHVQLEDGSWSEEIWDTAMCLLALMRFRVSPKDASVQKALAWIADKYSLNGRSNWHDEHWETSWALIAILRTGLCPAKVDVPAAVRWLASYQDRSGRIIAPHHTAYFLLICQNLGKIKFESHDDEQLPEEREKAIRYLLDVLGESKDGLWTGEVWSNGQILWILAEGNSFPTSDPELLSKTLRWFEWIADKKAWCDVEDAASAILGMHSLLKRLEAAIDGHDPRRKTHIQEELQKRISVPRLYLSHRLWQRENDGSWSFNIRSESIQLIYRIGGALATLGVAATLIDFSINHWKWLKWLTSLLKR